MIVTTLLASGNFNAIGTALAEPLRDIYHRIGLWRALLEALAKEQQCFGDEELAQLERASARDVTRASGIGSRLPSGIAPAPTMGGMDVRVIREPIAGIEQRGNLLSLLEEIERTIKRVQYLRLRLEIQHVINPEINTDRLELISRVERIGFRGEITRTLRDLEPRLLAASRPLDFKSCMDIIRTIFEEIVEDAAKKAASVTGVTVPSGKVKDFQPWKDLLSTTGVLTPEEADLCQKLYNYFSNVGAHRLGSSHEHVRVAKNMTIEVGLLIVGRLQALATS